jgi:hypothetical protein
MLPRSSYIRSGCGHESQTDDAASRLPPRPRPTPSPTLRVPTSAYADSRMLIFKVTRPNHARGYPQETNSKTSGIKLISSRVAPLLDLLKQENHGKERGSPLRAAARPCRQLPGPEVAITRLPIERHQAHGRSPGTGARGTSRPRVRSRVVLTSGRPVRTASGARPCRPPARSGGATSADRGCHRAVTAPTVRSGPAPLRAVAGD